MTIQPSSSASAKDDPVPQTDQPPPSLRYASIDAVARQLGDGSISAVQLCEHVLAAVDEVDGSLRGYSQVLSKTALTEAAASDARRKAGHALGPLDGIPLAVKDLIDTRPAVCRAGLDHLADYVPNADAGVVAALRQAGAVIVGVTETDPGAFSTDTPRTINPLGPDRTVGGSSGGSAAVVAAGLAFAAIGTDTGGSIRIPAACCSIYGFKPTWGRIDTSGVRPLAYSLDHVGPLARSVADLTLVQSVLDPALGAVVDRDGAWSLGTCPAYFADAAPDVQASVAATLDALRMRGAAVREVALPSPTDVLAFHMVNLPKEAADYHTSRFPDAWPDYPEIARATVEAGRNTNPAGYAAAEEQRAAATAMVERALETVDAIILPTMPVDAPPRDMRQVALGHKVVTKLEATIRYTALFNQTGHPVLELPATMLADGRALGIQLVGKKNQDASLLALAARIERVLSIRVDYADLVQSQAQNARRVRAELA
ncbi:amidase [Mesorhizobium sp.]|uniref:amidase n=1 Tax=Mesorhizobium sp. TaxID=1871066 RepID=UPI000FEAA8A9|nr:amidase [Mesorhizobium sp.]RWJ32003.1 MAG: amidase [Mesorhizobium sp.]TIQ73791.1 MAG: amidase [Mesorhizobium sp.]